MALFDNRYELEELLGRGAFAEVWRAKDDRTGVTLALKIYAPTTGLDDNGIEGMTHEFSLMVNANHQNLLRPMYFDICERKPYLVLPYCANGNISNRVGQFSERDTWKLLHDVAAGLAYLHGMKPPVIHQDIKPANILVADDGTFMITDFGVSINARNTMQQAAAKDIDSGGTIAYMAPERFSKNNRPIMANDIFSLGCMAYEMLVGELPFGNHGGLLPLNGAEIPDVPNDVSQKLKDVIAQCLAKEPWDRPRAQQLEEITDQVLGLHHTVFETVAPHEPTAPATTTETPAPQPSAAPVQTPEPAVQPEPQPAQQPAQPASNRAANPFGATVVGRPQAPAQQENFAPTPSYNSAYPEQKSHKGLIMGIIAIVLVALGAGGYFLFGSSTEPQNVQSEAEVQAPATQTEETITATTQSATNTQAEAPAAQTESPATTQPETKQETATAPAPKQEATAPAKEKTTTPAKEKTEKKQEAATDKAGTLNLGYATWKGPVKNGKPDGYGTLTFTSAHIIDSYDPDKNQAQAGDRVEGEFANGHLNYGKWYKTDGSVVSLLIGM